MTSNYVRTSNMVHAAAFLSWAHTASHGFMPPAAKKPISGMFAARGLQASWLSNRFYGDEPHGPPLFSART